MTTPRTRLGLESLDRRDLPSTVTLDDGLLMITGTGDPESVSVMYSSFPGYTRVSVATNPPPSGPAPSVSYYFPTADIDLIYFYGHGGDDVFGNGIPVQARAYGGAGHDKLTGGVANDVLDGGIGNDSLFGGNGTDILRGGADSDYLDGGQDMCHDVLTGGAGADIFRSDNVWKKHPSGYWYPENIDEPTDKNNAEGDTYGSL